MAFKTYAKATVTVAEKKTPVHMIADSSYLTQAYASDVVAGYGLTPVSCVVEPYKLPEPVIR